MGFSNPCISRIFFYLVMLLTRLRDYNPEDRNGKINNIKIVKGLTIKMTLNVHYAFW